MLRRLSDLKARPDPAPRPTQPPRAPMPRTVASAPVTGARATPVAPRWQDLASRLTSHLTASGTGGVIPTAAPHAPSRPSAAATFEDASPSPGATP